MKKEKPITLEEVVIDGVPYQIEIDDTSDNPQAEAMIIFGEQRIVINELPDRSKSDYTRLNDLFHEIAHGIIQHRLSNFHLLDRATHEEQERLVQEIGTGFFNCMKDSPQLLKVIENLCTKKKGK